LSAKKTKQSNKAKRVPRAEPSKIDLAEYRRQNPPYVVVDTGVGRLSQKKKVEIVQMDRVERLFSGADFPNPVHPDKPMELDKATEAIRFRQTLQRKSKAEKEELFKHRRLDLDLNHLAVTHPDEATEIILYALLRLPQESLSRVREQVRHCIKQIDTERPKRGRGKPKGSESTSVLTRWLQVAFLKHGKNCTWSQTAKYLGLSPTKPMISTLTRQRNKYAELVYRTLVECGVGGTDLEMYRRNLGRQLSLNQVQGMLHVRCGLAFRSNPSACTKFATELFLPHLKKASPWLFPKHP
jgi:hypothetical protein